MSILTLDGSHGEGGGQILRTALSLSMIGGRGFRLVNIRARRSNPGLLPQHLSAVRAAATISGASISGDELGSTELDFVPSRLPKCGCYAFDVAETAGRGSAGSVSLVLQTLLIPLALAEEASALVLRGGTHVKWSPCFDDLVNVYFPVLRRMGLQVEAELIRWGWYPAGGGEVVCRIAVNQDRRIGARPTAIDVQRPGPLRRIAGRAVTANLPAHIPLRMAVRARGALVDLGVPVDIEPMCVSAAGAGAGIFLTAQYESISASFSAHGHPGKPSEAVADQVAAAVLEHHASGAAVEVHLADQLLLPLALATGVSVFTVARPTGHLITNAWTIGQFSVADISIEKATPYRVRIEPRVASLADNFRRGQPS